MSIRPWIAGFISNGEVVDNTDCWIHLERIAKVKKIYLQLGYLLITDNQTDIFAIFDDDLLHILQDRFGDELEDLKNYYFSVKYPEPATVKIGNEKKQAVYIADIEVLQDLPSCLHFTTQGYDLIDYLAQPPIASREEIIGGSSDGEELLAFLRSGSGSSLSSMRHSSEMLTNQQAKGLTSVFNPQGLNFLSKAFTSTPALSRRSKSQEILSPGLSPVTLNGLRSRMDAVLHVTLPTENHKNDKKTQKLKGGTSSKESFPPHTASIKLRLRGNGKEPSSGVVQNGTSDDEPRSFPRKVNFSGESQSAKSNKQSKETQITSQSATSSKKSSESAKKQGDKLTVNDKQQKNSIQSIPSTSGITIKSTTSPKRQSRDDQNVIQNSPTPKVSRDASGAHVKVQNLSNGKEKNAVSHPRLPLNKQEKESVKDSQNGFAIEIPVALRTRKRTNTVAALSPVGVKNSILKRNRVPSPAKKVKFTDTSSNSSTPEKQSKSNVPEENHSPIAEAVSGGKKKVMLRNGKSYCMGKSEHQEREFSVQKQKAVSKETNLPEKRSDENMLTEKNITETKFVPKKMPADVKAALFLQSRGPLSEQQDDKSKVNRLVNSPKTSSDSRSSLLGETSDTDQVAPGRVPNSLNRDISQPSTSRGTSSEHTRKVKENTFWDLPPNIVQSMQESVMKHYFNDNL